jgi:putative endopeptidase
MRTQPLRPSLVLSLLLPGVLSVGACESNELPRPAVPSLTASLPPEPKPAPSAPVIAGHSVDLSAMDASVRPGNDFFFHANGSWFKKAEIPADRSFTGVDLRLEEEAETRTRGILDEAALGKSPAGSDLQKIGDYYASYLDEAGIEARGTKPLAPLLDRIAKIADKKALAAYLGSELRADVDPLNDTNFYTDHVLGLWVEQDLNDPSRAAPYLLQGGLGMPDRSFYLDKTPSMEAMRAKYVTHLAAMLKLAGISDPDAKAKRVFELEHKIAESHATRAESEDVEKSNNVWPAAEFAKRAPGMDWSAYLAAAGLDKQTSFIVWHPHAVTGLAALVQGQALATWKEYLTMRALEHGAWFLPKAFADEHFAFYRRALRGVPTPLPRWKHGIELTNDAVGVAVGKAYVERYFPAESKKAVEALVATIIQAFARRIDALPWMAAATKAKAKEKLSTLYVGLGYPDRWRSYAGLEVVRGDAFGNLFRAELFETKRNLARLGKPVDHAEWAMLPHIVNAVNLPVRNALNFPAGILVPPYFDPHSTAAANYGAVGAVIGHEISHSFDDQGAMFDAHGRLQNWWAPEDLAHFQASGAALAAQFSAYRPFPDAVVDGKQTLGENIADLAGLAASYDAWKASLGGAPAPVQDGLTGDQQFFLSFAQGWQVKIREQAERERLATDGHAPAHYRTLTVRNLDPWYAAFDVKPEDTLYLAPDARVRVW